MSVITDAQVRVLVGEELGLINGNEPLAPDVDNKIARRMTAVRAWLQEEKLCYWLANNNPQAAALPYAKIIAGQCATVFGRGPESPMPYLGGPEGFALLEQHCSIRSKHERVQAEYF